jgi:hypothetical protein
MHQSRIKIINANLAYCIHKYKSVKEKLLTCNANLYFNKSCLNYILLILSCNNDGSVGIACSSPLNIFIHVIPEDGPYGPKHVVEIIRA